MARNTFDNFSKSRAQAGREAGMRHQIKARAEQAFNGYKETWREEVDQFSSFLDGMNPFQQLAFATASANTISAELTPQEKNEVQAHYLMIVNGEQPSSSTGGSRKERRARDSRNRRSKERRGGINPRILLLLIILLMLPVFTTACGEGQPQVTPTQIVEVIQEGAEIVEEVAENLNEAEDPAAEETVVPAVPTGGAPLPPTTEPVPTDEPATEEETVTPIEEDTPEAAGTDEIVEIEPTPEATPHMTYTYEEALSTFPKETIFGTAIRVKDTETIAAESESGKETYGFTLPEYIYVVQGDQSVKVTVGEPTFKVVEEELSAQLESGYEIIFSEIAGWIIPQFNTTVLNSEEPFATFAITVDQPTRDQARQEAVGWDQNPDKITPIFGLSLTQPEDFFNSPFYSEYMGSGDPSTDFGKWYEENGFGLQNSPFFENQENITSEEMVNILFIKAFAIMFFEKEEISIEEFNAIKEYTFGNPEQRSAASTFLAAGEISGQKFVSGQPLRVTLSQNKGEWQLNQGILFVKSEVPVVGGWEGSSIGSGSNDPIHTSENQKLFVSYPSISSSGWQPWIGIIRYLENELEKQDIETKIPFYFESISVVPGKINSDGSQDGPLAVSPLAVLEAINPETEGNGVPAVEITKVP